MYKDGSLTSTYPSFLNAALLFHPSLELFISVNNVGHMSDERKQALSRFTTADDAFSLGEYEEAVNDLFTDISYNLEENSEFWSNRTMQCDWLKSQFYVNTLPCSYDYISYDPQCLANVRMPISPNLQEVYISNMFYNEYSIASMWYKMMQLAAWNEADKLFSRTSCLQSNKLKLLDISFGSIQISGTLNMRKVYKSEISGLEQLETFNANYANLGESIRENVLAVSPLPSIRNLFLRATNVLLPNDIQLCSKMKNLTNIDLSQNSINGLPENMFHILH